MSPPASYNSSQVTSAPVTSASPEKQEAEPFDEFDPRGSVSAVPFGSVSGTESLSMIITHCFSL